MEIESNYNSKKSISGFVSELFNDLGIIVTDDVKDDNNHIETYKNDTSNNESHKNYEYMVTQCEAIEDKLNDISNYFIDVKKTLDESIYGLTGQMKDIVLDLKVLQE